MEKLDKRGNYYIAINGFLANCGGFPFCISKKHLKTTLQFMKEQGQIKEGDEIKILAVESYYYYEDFNNIK